MLLVNDRQPQASKLYLLLNQRVGPHRNVGRAACNGCQPLLPQGLALAPAFEKNHRQAEGGDEGLNSEKVLLGEDLGRGHQRRLVAIFHGPQHRAQPHQGLARADVALDEAIHNLGTLHLRGDLGDDPALGVRWGKRQGIPQGRHQFFTRRESYAVGLLAVFLAPPCQAQLEGEKLAKSQALARALRFGKAGGKMHLAQTRAPLGQAQALPQGGGQVVFDALGKGVQRLAYQAAEPPAAQAALLQLGTGRIERNDRARVEPLLPVNEFVFGMDHLPPPLKEIDLAAYGQFVANGKVALQVASPLKKDAGNVVGLVGHDHHEAGPRPGHEARLAHLANERDLLADGHPGHGQNLCAVEVAARQIVQQIAQRPNFYIFERGRAFGPYAFDFFNGSGQNFHDWPCVDAP